MRAGTIERAFLVLLLGLGWLWQGHRQLRIVDVYLTTASAQLGAAAPTRVYPARVRSICAYLVYADSRPGVDTYSYRFAGASVFFRDIAHRTDVAHGVALDCFDTGGALPPGRYEVTVLLDGNVARTLRFTVSSPPVTP
ncbi:MAG: hypothetical protein ACRDG4_18380 [Chloroflexota bacterium]